ncbi:hypothetical protein MMC28_001149 [Mycoblastus sanguinarius]|nr:hypothetical protein [Mycoblastus sanguinarius]
MLPQLASCNYALHRLELANQACGPENAIFGPVAYGPRGISLPATFIGAGTDYTPITPIWCAILILWQPRPTVQPPSPSALDVFPFSQILQAAYRIRDQCLLGTRERAPQIGREWIEPHQWVDVQYAGVYGVEELRRNWSDAALRGEKMKLSLSDGTNQTVFSSVPQWIGCGTSFA